MCECVGPVVGGLSAAAAALAASALSWRWICHSTTSLQVNIKKKTRAGADRSSLSSTTQCKEIAPIIRESKIQLATCLVRPDNKIHYIKLVYKLYNNADLAYYEEWK